MKDSTFERRRLRVLEAAGRLFSDLDYERVHMEAVAEAAEIAKPTLYRYFATKEALFLAALDQTLSEVVAEVARLRGGSNSAEERLRLAIDLVFERIGSLGPALHAVESRGEDPEENSRKSLRRGFGGLRDEFAALLDEGARRDEFAFADSDLAALAIVGALRMAAIAAPASGRSAALLADLLLGGLRKRPALAPAGSERPRSPARSALLEAAT